MSPPDRDRQRTDRDRQRQTETRRGHRRQQTGDKRQDGIQQERWCGVVCTAARADVGVGGWLHGFVVVVWLLWFVCVVVVDVWLCCFVLLCVCVCSSVEVLAFRLLPWGGGLPSPLGWWRRPSFSSSPLESKNSCWKKITGRGSFHSDPERGHQRAALPLIRAGI